MAAEEFRHDAQRTVSVRGLNFTVAMETHEGQKWIHVHPAPGQKDSGLHDPAGFLQPRDAAVAIGGGTEEGLTEEQAHIARAVTLALQHRFSNPDKGWRVQRHVPGQDEPPPRDEMFSTDAYITGPQEILSTEDTRRYLSGLEQDSAFRDIFMRRASESTIQKVLSQSTLENDITALGEDGDGPGSHARQVRPPKSAPMVNGIMDILRANIPGILEAHCTVVAAQLAEYMLKQGRSPEGGDRSSR